MSTIVGQIISISRGIDRRRRFLKNKQIIIKSVDHKWLTVQTQLRTVLGNAFQISQDDVVDYLTFLQHHFDDLNKKLIPDTIHQFDTIIVSMRNIENFLTGMIAGYFAHAKSLGSYSGLIYDSYNDSPVGGEYDDCDMIVVAKNRCAFAINNLVEMSGKIFKTRCLDSTESMQLNLHDTECCTVLSILH